MPGDVVGPMSGMCAASLLTQGLLKPADSPAASGGRDISYFMRPCGKQPLKIAASFLRVKRNASWLRCRLAAGTSDLFHAPMITCSQRAGINLLIIFRQHGECKIKFVCRAKAFTDLRTFGCRFEVCAVS